MVHMDDYTLRAHFGRDTPPNAGIPCHAHEHIDFTSVNRLLGNQTNLQMLNQISQLVSRRILQMCSQHSLLTAKWF